MEVQDQGEEAGVSMVLTGSACWLWPLLNASLGDVHLWGLSFIICAVQRSVAISLWVVRTAKQVQVKHFGEYRAQCKRQLLLALFGFNKTEHFRLCLDLFYATVTEFHRLGKLQFQFI